MLSFLLSKDWSLRIQRVEPSDSGAYKCQANSHPPQFITTYLSIHGTLGLGSRRNAIEVELPMGP